MSYTFNNPCGTCKNGVDCSDKDVIYGAICAIHSMGCQKGHKGAGSVDLNCCRKEEYGPIHYVKPDGTIVPAKVTAIWNPSCINLECGEGVDAYRATSVSYSAYKKPGTWHF